MKLLLAGGGTGGHLFPAIALAEQLKSEEPQSEVLFVGTERGLEARMLPELGWPLKTIEMSGWAGLGAFARLKVLGKLTRSFAQSRKILREFNPDVVVGVGGYASVPALLAAKTLGIPYLVHEQNAWPGLANRLLGHWAKRVCLSFDEADRAFHRSATVLTGNPVRSAVLAVDPPAIRMEGRSGVANLLITGGSQGARALNRVLPAAVALMPPDQRPRILHQAGKGWREETVEAYQKAGIEAEVTEFIDDMAVAYGWADLVVCRAGALTVSELAAAGLASVLVPFPHAVDDHQTMNAEFLVEAGAAELLPEGECSAEALAGVFRRLLADREQLVTMAKAARSVAVPDSADRVAALCREFMSV